MLPFYAFGPAEIDTASRCYDFGSSVLFGFLQSNNVATHCSTESLIRVSMRPIPLISLTTAVRMLNVPNVSSPSRHLALAASLCFMRAVSVNARLPRRVFRANVFHLPLSSRGFLARFLSSFFRRVGCSTPNTPRPLHRRHFCLLSCALRAFLLSSLRVPRFPRRRCTNTHGCSGKSMILVGLHCQHRRALASIDAIQGHRFTRELTLIVRIISNICGGFGWIINVSTRTYRLPD